MKKNLLKNMTAAIAALFIALLALPQTALAQSKEAYVVENGSTLTFYYDTNKATRTGTVYGIYDKRTDDTKVPAWAGSKLDKNERTTKVVFDSSFKDYRPATTASWFCICTKLETIEGIENLNTEEVTDMNNMFLGCKSLTSIDVTNFNTAKVTDMRNMFSACSALTTIYCYDNWNRGVVKESTGMFIGSRNLKGFATYDETRTDVSMANPSSGYFTRKTVAYVVDNGSTLTFYYDTKKATRTGTAITIYGIDEKRTDDTDIPAWAGTFGNENVRTTKAVFNSSFKNYRPTTTAYWFDHCTKLETIEGMENLNTEEVTDMCYMFSHCESLTSLDISKFNTANVTTMSCMFYGCSALTSLDLSNFNTANVTTMSYMFRDCKFLKSLDVSNFNTANVKYMNYMFYGCTYLKSLDVSKFNTAKVKNMSNMFFNCEKLTALDVSNFNTEEVTDMTYMFYDCKSLTSLDVSNFNTAKVTDMRHIFYGCEALTALDVSNFNTENVTSMSFMFRSCKSLTSIDVTNFNTAKVTSMQEMFRGCSSLTSLNVSSFNTAKVNNLCFMFCDCTSMTSLNVSNFNTGNVTDMRCMFYNCSSLTSIDVTNFNTAKVTIMSSMFSGCSAMTTIYCNDDWTKGGVTESENMFKNCTKLKGAVPFDATKTDVTMANPTTGYFTKIVAYVVENGSTLTFYYDANKATRTGNVYDISTLNWTGNQKQPNTQIKTVVFDSSFKDYRPTTTASWFDCCTMIATIKGMENLNTEEVTNMSYMFYNCSSLTSLDVSNFNTEKVTAMSGMFSACSALTTIYCDADWTKGVVTDSNDMFYGCSNLKGAVPFDATKTDVTMANPTTGYFTKYLGLMIAGEKVTTANCKDLSIFSEVNGTASYDPATKTLTLKDATIETALNTVYGIENESVDNLTVKLLGTNKIDCNDIAVIFGKNTSIIGPGSLDIVSNYMDGIKLNNNASLEIKDGAKVTVSGNDHGIYGSDSGSESLVVNNASLSAIGKNGSICGLKTFRIKDCTVTQPKDCNFNSSRRAVTIRNSIIIVTDWVKITPTASAITLTEADALPAQKQGVYNLRGVRMKDDINNLPAGIYVIDGRKVVKR